MKTLCLPAVLHREFWSQNLPKKGCESQQVVMALQEWHSAERLQLQLFPHKEGSSAAMRKLGLPKRAQPHS